MKKMLLVIMVMLASAAVSLGAIDDPSGHPRIPEDATWVRPLVTLIIGMFIVAIPVGMFVRATMPEEVPPAHAHDEHHGHKDPEHDHGLGEHDARGHGH